MSCGLVTGWMTLRRRAMQKRAFARIARATWPDRRLRWRRRMGSYHLCLGETAQTVDYDFPVGIALPGSEIAESLSNRPVQTGLLYYAVLGMGPLGVEDDGPPEILELELVDGEVLLPLPPSPAMFLAEPSVAGQVAVTCMLDNTAVAAKAASISLYGDGGTGAGIDWDDPIGDPIPVRSGFGRYRFTRDPGLPHGTLLTLAVRTKSAAGREEQNTITRVVRLDAEGPAKMSDFTMQVVCNE